MLGPAQRQTLLDLARRAVAAAAADKPSPEITPDELLSEKGAAFVTLRRSGSLRGCMGHIVASAPLWLSVRDMARSAARSDPRFPPVAPEELGEMTIEISVLSPLRKIRSSEDVSVGRDGLYVKRKHSAGLLLPQVAVTAGWNPRQFLEQTCRKADLPPIAWQDPETELFAFTAEIFGEEPEHGPSR